MFLQLSTPTIEKHLTILSEALRRAFQSQLTSQTNSIDKQEINTTANDEAAISEPLPPTADPFPFKRRIGRVVYYQNDRTSSISWVDQNRWEELYKQAEAPAPSLSDVPAVLYQIKDNKKWLAVSPVRSVDFSIS